MDYVAVVDPYSSGKYLPAEFARKGCKCICIHSRTPIPKAYADSFFKENFIDCYSASLISYNELLEVLKRYACKAVVAGTEPGVELANNLADGLGLKCCQPDKVKSLRDKFLMQEEIKKSGLRSIHQQEVFSIADALDFFEAVGNDVVIKPLSSAGTDKVFFCTQKHEIENAVRGILGEEDALGNINKKLLAQELIEGKEYVIDSVSLESKHYITSCSIYNKVRTPYGSNIYAEEVFIHPNDPRVEEVVSYGVKALDALGIKFGAAHAEIKCDGNGPVLIEVGARLHGANAPKHAQYYSNISQLDLLVDACVDQQSFFERTKQPPKFNKYAKAISFVNSNSGSVIGIPGKAWVETLASYTLGYWNIAVGDEISRTTSLLDSPGGVFLAHSSTEAIDSDTKLIREMENQGRLWCVG